MDNGEDSEEGQEDNEEEEKHKDEDEENEGEYEEECGGGLLAVSGVLLRWRA